MLDIDPNPNLKRSLVPWYPQPDSEVVFKPKPLLEFIRDHGEDVLGQLEQVTDQLANQSIQDVPNELKDLYSDIYLMSVNGYTNTENRKWVIDFYSTELRLHRFDLRFFDFVLKSKERMESWGNYTELSKKLLNYFGSIEYSLIDNVMTYDGPRDKRIELEQSIFDKLLKFKNERLAKDDPESMYNLPLLNLMPITYDFDIDGEEDRFATNMSEVIDIFNLLISNADSYGKEQRAMKIAETFGRHISSAELGVKLRTINIMNQTLGRQLLSKVVETEQFFRLTPADTNTIQLIDTESQGRILRAYGTILSNIDLKPDNKGLQIR